MFFFARKIFKTIFLPFLYNKKIFIYFLFFLLLCFEKFVKKSIIKLMYYANNKLVCSRLNKVLIKVGKFYEA